MKEIWKDVKGYEGVYQASNQGKIRSLDKLMMRKDGKRLFCKGSILNPHIGSYGYRMVTLCSKGESVVVALHRVIANTFIPNTYNLPSINHKDENKLNNNTENLEWCTVKYNNNYGTRNKRITEKNMRPVFQYDRSGKFIKEWQGVITASKELGLNNSHIASTCRKERKACGGYIWRYNDEYYKNNNR